MQILYTRQIFTQRESEPKWSLHDVHCHSLKLLVLLLLVMLVVVVLRWGVVAVRMAGLMV